MYKGQPQGIAPTISVFLVPTRWRGNPFSTRQRHHLIVLMCQHKTINYAEKNL